MIHFLRGKTMNNSAKIITRYQEWMAEFAELAPDLAAKVPPLTRITPVMVRAYAREDDPLVQHLVQQRPWYPSPVTPWEILGEEFTPEEVTASPDRIWFSGQMYAITIKRLLEEAAVEQKAQLEKVGRK